MLQFNGFKGAALALALTSASALAAPPLKIHSHTAPPDGFLVGSYALEQAGEIVVVDTQMLATEAKKFAEELKKAKAKVTAVYVTHAHPDHYLGLAVWKEEFPEAKLLASPETADIIAAEGAARLKFYREQFASGAMAPALATSVPAVEKLEGNILKVGKTELEILTFPEAEAKTAHALWHKQTRALITGDLAYNNVHLWLADQAPAKWVDALKALQKLNPKKVYPGHGEPGDARLLKYGLDYLAVATDAIATSKTAEEYSAKIKAKYPNVRLPMIVDMAAAKYFPPPAAPAPTTSAPAVKKDAAASK